jgi:hypothetical protein
VACASHGPSAPALYTVVVDLYSGQSNPEVELSSSVGEQRRYYDLVLSDVGSRLTPGVLDVLP